MVYVRGHALDYDRWAYEVGDDNWDYKHLLPYFKRAQKFHGDRKEENFYRGYDGYLSVAEGPIDNPIYQAFLKAGVEAGYPFTDDINGFQQEGFGRLPMTVNPEEGMRWSAASAYLRPALERPNLTVIDSTMTDKIIFNDSTAVGIAVSNFRDANEKSEIFGEEIILSGGAINSPQILQLSGIGNIDLLKKHDIKTIVDLKGVGENLQDHVEVCVIHECLKPVSLYSSQKWYNMARIGTQWFLTRKGICASNNFHTGAFFRSRAGKDIAHPDVQLHFVLTEVVDHGRKLPDSDSFQAHVNTQRAKSIGNVRIKSTNPRDHPLIDPKYFEDQSDLTDLINAVRLAREIFAQKAFDELRGREKVPGSQIQSDKEIANFIKDTCETEYHPSCSNKMGKESDEMAVVDSKCRVYGTQSLRIVDASIIPSVPSGNLNAPTIALAEKAADIILGRESPVEPNADFYKPDLTLQR